MTGCEPYPPAVGAVLVRHFPGGEKFLHRPVFENWAPHDEKAGRAEDVAAVLKMVPHVLSECAGAGFALVDFAGLKEWSHAIWSFRRFKISRGRMVM